ncbi:unnamed protein product, partial [Meganyctiphanes norvegica]
IKRRATFFQPLIEHFRIFASFSHKMLTFASYGTMTIDVNGVQVNKTAIPKGPTKTLNFEFWDLRLFQWGIPYSAEVAATIAVNTLGFAYTDAHEHLYSTIRNTSQHHHAWRRHLGFDEVLNIQEECKEVLDGLGYSIYNTSSQYMDPDINPVNSLPLGVFEGS